MDYKTIRTVIHDNLSRKSYIRMLRHRLTEFMKIWRLETCKTLLRWIMDPLLKYSSQWTTLWSTEMIGTLWFNSWRQGHLLDKTTNPGHGHVCHDLRRKENILIFFHVWRKGGRWCLLQGLEITWFVMISRGQLFRIELYMDLGRFPPSTQSRKWRNSAKLTSLVFGLPGAESESARLHRVIHFWSSQEDNREQYQHRQSYRQGRVVQMTNDFAVKSCTVFQGCVEVVIEIMEVAMCNYL